jgi:hypothetical membrane protein
LALTTKQRIGPGIGLLGAMVFGATSLIAALVYSGAQGEGFSPLNHWVSELGEEGVSRLATLYNVGLMVSGICLAIFMTALGLHRGGRLAWLYVPIGIVAGIGGAFVGVFPMSSTGPHIPAALTFFVLGWISVGLASIDIWRRPDPRFPRWLPWLGALTVLAFLIFLSLYIPYLTYTGAGSPDRAPLELVVVFEWLVLIGIMAWVFIASASWLRYRDGNRNPS